MLIVPRGGHINNFGVFLLAGTLNGKVSVISLRVHILLFPKRCYLGRRGLFGMWQIVSLKEATSKTTLTRSSL